MILLYLTRVSRAPKVNLSPPRSAVLPPHVRRLLPAQSLLRRGLGPPATGVLEPLHAGPHLPYPAINGHTDKHAACV